MTDYYSYDSKIVNYINSWYNYFFPDYKNNDENSINSSIKQSKITDYYKMADIV
tara:strand:+ start:294 stop:455 length:162 start_codon:yes stop_codon:yes gene_type:complete